MRLFSVLVKFFHLFWNTGRVKRYQAQGRALKRQVLNILLHGKPKFILAASQADADACAAPMAFLLVHNLTVDQVWWRHVKAGNEYSPHLMECFIPIKHFDTGRKFDGKVIDGKVVEPGRVFFDHHHAREANLPELFNHCATSLVVGSFPAVAKDPIVRFISEYVRLIDTGHPGEASEFLYKYTRGDGDVIRHSINLYQFFEVFGKPEMETQLKKADEAVFVLKAMFTELNRAGQYAPELAGLEECFSLIRAANRVIGSGGTEQKALSDIKKHFKPAAKAVAAMIEKFRDPDPAIDEELYLRVYRIEPSNAAILKDISAYIAGLVGAVSPDEHIRLGCLKFISFYNNESQRRKLLREFLPNGACKHLRVVNSSGKTVKLLVAEGVPYEGKTLRVITRQTLHDLVDLIVFSSVNGQMGLVVVDDKKRMVIDLHQLKKMLVEQFPVYQKSFVHDSGFVMYLKTERNAKGKRISFEALLAMAERAIKGEPIVAPPVVKEAVLSAQAISF